MTVAKPAYELGKTSLDLVALDDGIVEANVGECHQELDGSWRNRYGPSPPGRG